MIVWNLKQQSVQWKEDIEETKKKESIVIEDQDFRVKFNGKEWMIVGVERWAADIDKLVCYESFLKGTAREWFEKEVDR